MTSPDQVLLNDLVVTSDLDLMRVIGIKAPDGRDTYATWIYRVTLYHGTEDPGSWDNSHLMYVYNGMDVEVLGHHSDELPTERFIDHVSDSMKMESIDALYEILDYDE